MSTEVEEVEKEVKEEEEVLQPVLATHVTHHQVSGGCFNLRPAGSCSKQACFNQRMMGGATVQWAGSCRSGWGHSQSSLCGCFYGLVLGHHWFRWESEGPELIQRFSESKLSC